MDEPPPSYREAIRQKDWLEVAAPYIDIRDYASLCRVSQRFYAVFAIRLWKDPLTMLRQLQRNANSEHLWYTYFFDQMDGGLRKSTASMVAVMDFRDITMALYGLGPNPLDSNTLRDIPACFPNLRCLLLDEHSVMDPSMLSSDRVLSLYPRTSLSKLHLLSLANCGLPLPARFAANRWLRGLVYLDLSNTPGSLQSQIDQKSLKVANLPQLRILKIKGKGLDYATASAVIREFRTRLWSLDVSSNSLNDNFLNDLTELSLPTYSNIKLQTDGHFEAEGKIRSISDNSGYPNGRFYFIEESAWSATFTCPERYLADTPIYRPEDTDGGDNEGPLTLRTRSNGRDRIRGDSAADAMRVLAGGPGEAIPDAPHLRYSPHWPSPQAGTTHLHLNDLVVRAPAVQRLLQHSPGFIEHFECDGAILSLHQSSALVRKISWLPKSTILYGLPGAAYLFRPVISSNLRVLKIHHSLVTNTPTVASRTKDVLAKLWLAETCLRKRLNLAYPQTYVPDMNPRLYSLTLCMIPRYSTGAVTERLINFLKLAARQEQMIEKVKAGMPPRGPPVLQGLRHIRLEFDFDAEDEFASLANEADEVDPSELLSRGVDGFSFFSESAWDLSLSSVKSKAKEQPSVASTATKPSETRGAENQTGTTMPEKLDCAPFNQSEGQHINIAITPTSGFSQQLTVPVWIGSGIISPDNPPAVNEYMRNLCDPSNAQEVIAATPCHVVAGVPAGSFIFHRAWDVMLLPTAEEIRRPTRAALRGMKDVLEEIKVFRREARIKYAEVEKRRWDRRGVWIGEHDHWKGKLQVAVPQSSAQSSNYWR
ncbi:hypothetical protein VP1G_02592 [Cytospora mali]|uniref:Uncharacterized protein n=1 Tax=Cytospora mali TaxID=578113 RepID=A0A194UUI5_CYTMA|nr:hypothetical protein VP1G_02592 [Valsa mali var. pyri (nom. inval.)]